MATIKLDRPSPAGSADRSPHRHATYPPDFARARLPACLVLQAAGFSVPSPLPMTRCALTAPFHLTEAPKGPGGIFSVALSRGSPRRLLAAAAPCPARTFLRSFHSGGRSTHSEWYYRRNTIDRKGCFGSNTIFCGFLETFLPQVCHSKYSKAAESLNIK